jgi:hypothetical protein
MRIRFHAATFVIFGLLLISDHVFACSCVPPPPDVKTARELAAWNARNADAIFEARTQTIELKWTFMEAHAGDLIPALSGDFDHDDPAMLVTMDVLRSYRGDQSRRVQVTTGLGGGDCGFSFEAGKDYLVYAFKDEAGGLSTGICSATALLEESRANLVYLQGGDPERIRNEPSTPRRKICGRITFEDPPASVDSRLWLLPLGQTSPMPQAEGEADSDGTFCITDVRPGKYHLLFVNMIADSVTSFVYFPGVTRLSEAAEIEVRARRSPTGLVFEIPAQRIVSLSGKISVSGNLPLPTGAKVMLFSANQPLLALNYGEDVASDGSFVFHRVLPGEYWAMVAVDSSRELKWWTRKTRVDIGENISTLALELIAK